MNVYVAASFTDVARVREVHAELERMGLRYVSTWVRHADGSRERLEAMTDEARAAIIEENDSAVRRADVLIVLAGLEGKETFAEARFAAELGTLILWVGEPRPLTAYRRNVQRFADVELALAFLSGLAGRKPSVARRWGLPRVGV
jgi:hypothetical protein